MARTLASEMKRGKKGKVTIMAGEKYLRYKDIRASKGSFKDLTYATITVAGEHVSIVQNTEGKGYQLVLGKTSFGAINPDSSARSVLRNALFYATSIEYVRGC